MLPYNTICHKYVKKFIINNEFEEINVTIDITNDTELY